jgi:hypothetical protein
MQNWGGCLCLKERCYHGGSSNGTIMALPCGVRCGLGGIFGWNGRRWPVHVFSMPGYGSQGSLMKAIAVPVCGERSAPRPFAATLKSHLKRCEMATAMFILGSTAPVASVSGAAAPRQASVPAAHVLHGGSFTAPARAFKRSILTMAGSKR